MEIVYRNTGLGKQNLLIIDLFVNIVLDYLKKTVNNLFLMQQIYKQIFCEKSHLKLLSKILEKHLKKSSFLAEFQILKINSFTRIFQGFS